MPLICVETVTLEKDVILHTVTVVANLNMLILNIKLKKFKVSFPSQVNWHSVKNYIVTIRLNVKITFSDI